jgi:hypothetical protein|eukprot:Transcript_9332.p2 GENE.Transcript_9332~~Transcript_9332.p2  ORF type:complete len:318 (+),score=89.73 Transcript_9332:170-1123(+)
MLAVVAATVPSLRLGGLSSPTRCRASRWTVASEAMSESFRPLDREGNVEKRVLVAAPADAPRPVTSGSAPSLVTARVTARLSNGTIVDDSHSGEAPLELQLVGAGTDGLQRCLSTMSLGEVAEVRCTAGWAWSRGVRLPPGEPITYEVELLGVREGPEREATPGEGGSAEEEAEAAALMEQFQELQARQAAQGGASGAAGGTVQVRGGAARWREDTGEVSLWLRVPGELKARDVRVTFAPRALSVTAGGEELLRTRALRGKVEPDECWWAFDDEEAPGEGGNKALQLLLTKADRAVWAGIFEEDEEPEAGVVDVDAA